MITKQLHFIKRGAFIALMMVVLFATKTYAQLSGAYTIGAGQTYPTIDSIVKTLNSVGVSGAVVINIPAGYTETAPVGGLKLGSTILNATLSASNSLTFQKSGAGANPLITGNVGTWLDANVGSGQDIIWGFFGIDYTTIDGIDLIDPTTNTTATTANSYGYAFFKLNATLPLDGCNYNTVKNCTITMQRAINPYSAGITMDGRVQTGSVLLLPGSVSDADSYNKFYSNTIRNVGNGIFLRGYSNSIPKSLWDTNNDIGGSSLATGNNISSWGGTVASYAIYLTSQTNTSVRYNTINNYNGGANSGVAATLGTHVAIFSQNGNATYDDDINLTLSNNNITLTNGAGSAALYGVYSYYQGGNMNINNNTITVASTGLSTGSLYGVYYAYGTAVGGGAGKVSNCNNNIISGTYNCSTGSVYGLYHYYTSPQTNNISGNQFLGLTRTGITTGATYGMYVYSFNNYNTAGYTTNFYNNVVSNITFGPTQTSGASYLMYVNGSYTINHYNNIVSNITYNSTTATGAVYGMYNYYYYTVLNCYNNTIDNITHNGTGTYTMYVLDDYPYYASNTTYYGNKITNITASGSGTTLYAWYKYVVGGNFKAYNNKIANIRNVAAVSGANNIYGVYAYDWGGVSGNLGNVWYNNLISVGNSTAGASATMNTTGSVYGYFAPSTYANTHSLYNNTIYNFGNGNGAAHNNVSIWSAGTNQIFDLQNNIIMNFGNNTNVSPTGKVTLLRLGGTLAAFPAQLHANSNQNNWYMPSYLATYKPAMFDLTNSPITFAAMQALTTPREAASFSENTTFLSTTSSNANFLKVDATVVTQCESGAKPYAFITTDYFGSTRQGAAGYTGTGSNPDVGAHEFNGISPAPSVTAIAASPSTTQCTATGRTITCTITSPTSITAANLNYSFNGVAQTPVALTNTSGTTYSGAIPVAVPVNATVTYSITATNSGGYSSTSQGTAYADEPFYGLTFSVTANPDPVCNLANSTITLYTVGPNTLPTGYGVSNATNTGDEEILGVSFGTGGTLINTTSTCTTTGGAAANGLPASVVEKYSNYTGVLAPAVMSTGDVIPFTLTLGYCSGATYSNTTAIYIDLNRNGVFDMPTERLYMSPNNNGGSVAGSSFTRTGTITIPTTGIMPGYTLMRIVHVESATNNPTGTFSWGETEDYLINLKGTLPLNYTWQDNGSPFGTSAVTQTYTASTAGVHTISVSGVDANGCIATASGTLTVQALPSQPAVTNGMHCGLTTSSCSVLSTSGNANPIYKWYAATTGGSALQTDTLTHYNTAFNVTTTFYVTEITSGGCESNPRIAVKDSVIYGDAIVLSPASASICEGTTQALSFSQVGSNGNNYNFTWTAYPSSGSGLSGSVSGGNTASPIGYTATPTAFGTFNYVITGFDGTCTTKDTVAVVVNPLPVIGSATVSPNPVCGGSNVTISSAAYVPTSGSTGMPTGYLASNATSAADEELLNVSLGTGGSLLNNSSACSNTGGGASNGLPASIINMYSNYTSTVTAPALTIGATIPVSLTIGYCSGNTYSNIAAIFIDLNRNGTFDLPTEQLMTKAYGNGGSTLGSSYVSTGAMTIPVSAVSGYTLMRVVLVESTVASATGTYTWGETEDYKVLLTSAAGLNFAWTDGVTSPLASTANATVAAPVAGGTYNYSVTVTNPSTTCAKTSANIPVTVYSVPAAPTAHDSTQCGFGLSPAFVTSNSGYANPIYIWYDAATAGNTFQTYAYGPLTSFYTNNFSSSTLTGSSVTGNASVNSGVLTLTPNLTAQYGGFKVDASGVNSNKYKIEFDLNTSAAGADGASYSFGDDVDINANGAMNAENGTGTKLKVGFVTYTNGTSTAGIYLMYNCSVNEQTPTSAGVLSYSNNVAWRGTNAHVIVSIDSLGVCTVNVAGTNLCTANLGAAYLNANRYSWAHVFKARTGGIAQLCELDNVMIDQAYPSAGYSHYLTPISSTDTLYVTEANGICESSPRSAIILNVTAPPTLTVTTPQIICASGIRAMTVTSNLANYPVYSWAPATNLYTDAAATIPYTLGTNANTVYAKSASGGLTNYVALGYDPLSGCNDTAQTIIRVQPASAVVSFSPSSICFTGNSTVSLTPASTIYGGYSQWDTSTTNTLYGAVSGATALTYTTPTTTNTVYYQATIKDDQANTCITPYDTLIVYKPAVATTTPGTRCGTGTVTLGATPNSGSNLYWYNTATPNGNSIGSGNSYTTPTISATTNYYVQATSGGSNTKANLYTTNAAGNSAYGNLFDVNVLTTLRIDSFDIYATTAGTTYSIYYRAGTGTGFNTAATGWTLLNTGTISTLAAPTNSLTRIPSNVNLTLTPGLYSFAISTSATVSYTNGTAVGNIYAQNSDMQIKEGYGGSTANPGFGFLNNPRVFNGRIIYTKNMACASPVSTVIATVTTPPAITVTNVRPAICAGFNDTISVNSVNSGYSYTWTPGPLAGATQILSPTPTTNVQTVNNYTVTATDNSGGPNNGCVTTASTTITVNPNPTTPVVTPNPAYMLVGTPQMLTATGGTNGSAGNGIVGTGTAQNTSTTYPTPYGLWYGSSHDQYLITAAELVAAGIPAGSALNSLAFNVASIANSTPGYQYFTIRMAHTTATTMSAMVTTGFTTCYVNNPGFVLSATGWNNYAFTNNFTWNGTSNIVVDVSFSNCSVCNGTTSCTTGYGYNDVVYQTATPFVSTYTNYADNNCTINSLTPSLGSTATYSQRPNMKFGYNSISANPFYWSPAQSLYMNSNASTAYTAGGASNIVYANPRLDSVYTVTAINLVTGCKNVSTDSVYVEQFPSNYDCSHATALTITPTCNAIPGTSKYGWYNPAAIPTTPATPTTATCGNADDDVWYSFTRPAGMTAVTVRVVGSSNYDVAYEIVTGPCGGAQTVVACVNNTSGTSNSAEQYQILAPSGAPTNTYYVRVYDARNGYGSGDFTICVYGIVPPPLNNDPCGAANFSSNMATWGGATSILASYDGGAPIFMGQANNSTANPPTGVNLVYFSGSTAYANNLGVNEPVPPCGNLGTNAHSVWFKFKAPTIGGVDVTLRSLFNGNPTNFSNIIAAYVASVDPCTGTPTYTNIGCATTGVLSMTAASTVLAPYAGQFIYVQLTGNGASSPIGNYMLSVQAVPQNIALSSPTTSSLTVTLPTAPGATNVSVQWRAVGSSGYSLVNVSPSVGTYTITGLNSGVNYQVWAKYYNNTQAFYTNFATLGTTVGCSASPAAPSVVPVPNHCSRDTIQWFAHPLATSTYPYRLYWRQAASTGGYSVLAVPASAYNASTGKVSVLLTNLAVNTAYQFYYRVMCAGGAQVASNVANYTQCNGPAKLDGTFHGSFEHNGRYFVDADFVDVTSFTDNTPADGNVHEVVLNEVSDMNAVLNGSGVKVASNGEENGAFELIPNPTSDNVFVEYNLANAGRVVVRVMNIQGKVVKEEVMENSDASGAVQIDLRDVQSGVYMVSVDAPGYKATKRLVVTK